MIASVHVAAGIVIGTASLRLIPARATRIVVAFAAGFLAHLLMDGIPHSHYESLPLGVVLLIVILEFAAVTSIAALLLRRRLPPDWRAPMAAAVLGSSLPDAKFGAALLLNPELAEQVRSIGDSMHAPFHAGPTSLSAGMTTQLLALVLLLALMRAIRPSSTGGHT